MYAFSFTKNPVDWTADVFIEVHREDDLKVAASGEAFQRHTELFHASTEILTTMAGNQDDVPRRIEE